MKWRSQLSFEGHLWASVLYKTSCSLPIISDALICHLFYFIWKLFLMYDDALLIFLWHFVWCLYFLMEIFCCLSCWLCFITLRMCIFTLFNAMRTCCFSFTETEICQTWVLRRTNSHIMMPDVKYLPLSYYPCCNTEWNSRSLWKKCN